ncbi:hypothetical protein Krac_6786 [Ktedonobacter racemifer DSM 44963]|uniref:Uncharacterized protein n=1 Tax=Ktedonobacter racemifer DSM 44963 TaxID=485913 RepID=D6TPE8_KTERA|nr:hypothetical protein Krac_6786 [Ktedonobacter racemifer DSM 44963]
MLGSFPCLSAQGRIIDSSEGQHPGLEIEPGLSHHYLQAGVR